MELKDVKNKVFARGFKHEPEEVEFMIAHYPNFGKEYCMSALGRSEGSIRNLAHKLGLKHDRSGAIALSQKVNAAAARVGKKRPNQASKVTHGADGKFVKKEHFNVDMESVRIRTDIFFLAMKSLAVKHNKNTIGA